MTETTFGEDVNYWKTSRSSPDVWVERAKRQIVKLGGEVAMEGFGSEPLSGRSAYLLAFSVGGDSYKITWPVLASKTNDQRAARVQAATMLYHDVKAKCISAAVLGTRAAFFTYLMLPDGRVVSEASLPELAADIPAMLGGQAALGAGTNIVDGEFSRVSGR